jgi:hypothetical protein
MHGGRGVYLGVQRAHTYHHQLASEKIYVCMYVLASIWIIQLCF